MSAFLALGRSVGFAIVFTLGSVVSTLGTQAWADTYGSVRGMVLDETGVSIPEAKIQLLDHSGNPVSGKSFSVESSKTGEFGIYDVPFGDYQVEVTAPGMTSKKADSFHVSSGGKATVQVILKPALASSDSTSENEMVIKVSAKKQLIQSTSSVSRTELSKNQISVLPQGGEASLTKLVASTTPGVVQGGFGQLFIRGNHGNIQYQIDGVQMPDSPSGTFGQTFSPRNIEQMEIITGGLPAEFGQRLSGVMNIITKSGPEKPGGEVELNYGNYNGVSHIASPHLIYGGSNESGKFKYFFSANYNYTDRGLNTPQPNIKADGTFDTSQGGKESIHNRATGDAEFARVDWQIDNENKITIIGSNTASFFQIPNYPTTFPSSSPYFQILDGDGKSQFNWVPSGTNDTQSERNSYGQIIWKRTLSEKSFLQVAPYYKFSNVTVGNDPSNDLAGIAVNPSAEPTSIAQNRNSNNVGIKGDYSHRIGESHLVKTGFQVQAARSDGFFSIQKNVNSSPFVVNTATNGYFQGIYLQDDYTIFKPLVLNAGLRFDATQFSFGGLSPTDALLQPRVGLNYMATDTTKVHVSYSKKFEPAPVEALRLQFSGTSIAPYDIQAQKSDFMEAGASQQIGADHVVTLTGYYQTMKNVIDDHQLGRTSLSQQFNYDEGFQYGAEISMKGKLSPLWSHYFTYSYAMGKGRGQHGGIGLDDDDHDHDHGNPGTYVVLDHIQEHTANYGVTLERYNYWWTGQVNYGSGLRTGKLNAETLPNHFTVDTTFGYKFTGNQWYTQFKTSLDVVNILDNAYPITISNGYTGTQYAAGRQIYVRISKEF